MSRFQGVLYIHIVSETRCNVRLCHLCTVSRNVILTPAHQQDILVVVTRCHSAYVETLAAIFELRTAPAGDLVDAVKQVLRMGRLKEAVVCIFTFGVQDHFSMTEVLST